MTEEKQRQDVEVTGETLHPCVKKGTVHLTLTLGYAGVKVEGKGKSYAEAREDALNAASKLSLLAFKTKKAAEEDGENLA